MTKGVPRSWAVPIIAAVLLICGASRQSNAQYPQSPSGLVHAGVSKAEAKHDSMPGFGHLYVVRSRVYSYRLSQDGLPEGTPDGALDIEPWSIGFDAAGYLYATDSGSVQVYAPHAQGAAQPIRSFAVKGAEFLAVDAAGYVYVTSGYTSIEVFAPGANQSSTPINTITFDPTDYIMNLAVDALGRLYAYGGDTIYTFDDPIHESTPDGRFGSYGDVTPLLTIDVQDNRLYFRYERGANPWSSAQFRSLDLGGATPRASQWYFASDKCYNDEGSSGTFMGGLAVDENYLMFSCDTDNEGTLVYRNISGRQSRPVERLPGAGALVFGP
jgi:hypothetical protein